MEGTVGFPRGINGRRVLLHSARNMGQFSQRSMDKVKLSVVAWMINDSQIF